MAWSNQKHGNDTVSTRYRNVVKYLVSTGQVLCICGLILFSFNGCSISYKLNPNLSPKLSEGIRDLFQRQTRLQVLNKGGDLELEGEITGYEISQGAIGANSYATESKLTIRVTVHFTNNVYPEESFDKTYSASQTFDASRLLTDVQDELCAIIIQEIAENIYNDTVAKW